MDAMAAWVEAFAAAGRAAMAAEIERIATKIRGDDDVRSGARCAALVGGPVVLERGREIDAQSQACPASARRVVAAAGGAGWQARTVRALAADPRKGLIESITVRARRHDERLWAAWWNGSFQHAWYLGAGGLEQLGMARVTGKRITKIRGVLDAIEGIQLTYQDVTNRST